MVQQLWEDARFWRGTAAVLATTAMALLVAVLIAREPPDFAEQPVLAVVRDAGHHPVWTVRLARKAHQIAIDSFAPLPVPAGMDYRLWLVTPGVVPPQPLGLLPQSGRKVVAETPANIRRLGGDGELRVTLEPATTSLAGGPSAPPLFTAPLEKRD